MEDLVGTQAGTGGQPRPENLPHGSTPLRADQARCVSRLIPAGAAISSELRSNRWDNSEK